MTPARAAQVFFAFAFTYFFSALLRAVTATLAPVFSSELGLQAADLGLLGGAYFFGFAAMQLPLGRALDSLGPRRVSAGLLTLALLGCAGFALAHSLPGLVAARILIGVGVAACLMAPLTCFRSLFSLEAQLRANSWMLMAGSLGMVASTLPVQWLLPLWGWRGLFWGLALMLAAAIGVILLWVPRDPSSAAHRTHEAQEAHGAHGAHGAHAAPVAHAARRGWAAAGGYGAIVRHPLFRRMAPLGFTVYGGMIAVQSLWAGPWLTRVAGWSPQAAAQGLFFINLAMLFTFMAWGAVMPRLVRRGLHATAIVAWGVPLCLLLLGANVLLGERAEALHWGAWCIASSCISLSQPAVAQAFPQAQAGRALSAFNLVIFGGVFCLQWGIGLLIDALRAAGLAEPLAYRAAFGVFWLACMFAYLAFARPSRFRADNGRRHTARDP